MMMMIAVGALSILFAVLHLMDYSRKQSAAVVALPEPPPAPHKCRWCGFDDSLYLEEHVEPAPALVRAYAA